MSGRICPACTERTFSVRSLLFGPAECSSCQSVVGIHRLVSLVFIVIVIAVAALSTVAVYFQFGYFHAILWFPFPIGALSYIKARFFPLQVKSRPSGE